MKLLIVDDEELTRTGVISSIDWQSIGIREVLQADDGINGIEVARVHRPDIVLCDVRMPRLDGIAMLEQLEEILPDIVPVFMSGYSDKEYLKAAIKLKAVNYIEKPLNLWKSGMPLWKPVIFAWKKNVPGKMRPSIPWKALPAWLFFSPSLSHMRRKVLISS